MNYNTDFLKTGPCRVEYRGKPLGVTFTDPRLDIISELYEAKCCCIKDKAVRKIVANVKFVVSAELRETDKAFAALFFVNAGNGKVRFAESILITGGELRLSSVNGKRDICYRFPKAVLIPEAVADGGGLRLRFEVYEDPEGVLIRKIS
ncbi:MAG: hypothetical protein PHV82_03220 [Victivallaceae bacterium]|nr:hypothetical protein [Victivallaceae bacterium]